MRLTLRVQRAKCEIFLLHDRVNVNADLYGIGSAPSTGSHVNHNLRVRVFYVYFVANEYRISFERERVNARYASVSYHFDISNSKLLTYAIVKLSLVVTVVLYVRETKF